jgi:hypothetical protein
MNDREAAARLAAIANLPIGWVIDDPEWSSSLILQAIGPSLEEIEVSGVTAEEAWEALAEALAGLGKGRLIP